MYYDCVASEVACIYIYISTWGTQNVWETEMEGEKENPDGNAALVNSFCEITSSSKEEALFFLESHNFDLDAAVSTFLDNANNPLIPLNDDLAIPNPNAVSPPSDSHSPDFNPSRSPSPSPSPTRTPYELRSRRSLGKKPSTSRQGKIRTLGDLKRPSRDDDDSGSDPDFEPDEYYTGGEKRYPCTNWLY